MTEPNGSRRNQNAELQREFFGDPFLAPGRFLAIHLADQFFRFFGSGVEFKGSWISQFRYQKSDETMTALYSVVAPFS
jgi:hypothetical protein